MDVNRYFFGRKTMYCLLIINTTDPMKKLCTLPLILISWFCLAQGSWKTIEVPEGIRYDDIYFINDQIGWAVGNIRGYPNPLHRIYKTTNGGSNWNPIGPSNFPVYLRSIEFF